MSMQAMLSSMVYSFSCRVCLPFIVGQVEFNNHLGTAVLCKNQIRCNAAVSVLESCGSLLVLSVVMCAWLMYELERMDCRDDVCAWADEEDGETRFEGVICLKSLL